MKFDLKKFAAIVSQVAPIALMAAGVPPEITAKVTHLIVLAQSKPGKSGSEKKAFVLDALKTGASITDDLHNPAIDDIDEEQLTGAVAAGIDGTIAMVDAVKNIPAKAK